MSEKSENANVLTSRNALMFVVLIGIVSLFADTTYEGARSIAGPFLGSLGADGLTVGIIVGLGELVGYSVRMFSGILSDKMKNYWLITFTGYIINLFAVPLLALAGSWEIAALLIIAERFGKGVRNPPRDAMLSHAGTKLGSGKAFALHEALDQTGAIIGPLILATVLLVYGPNASVASDPYRYGYALLLIPAILAILTLIFARSKFPHPKDFEPIIPLHEGSSFSKTFWVFLIAMALIASGFADFPIIAFHLSINTTLDIALIPVLYALAMGVDAIASIFIGYAFDRTGLIVLAVAAFISSFSAFFAFSTNESFVVIGIILWAISLGAQETLIGATIGQLVPKNKRSTAYGIFNTSYGFAWFLGSAIIGYFLDINIMILMVFSFIVQILAIPLLIYVGQQMKKDSNVTIA